MVNDQLRNRIRVFTTYGTTEKLVESLEDMCLLPPRIGQTVEQRAYEIEQVGRALIERGI